jgi:cysteine desulfurase
MIHANSRALSNVPASPGRPIEVYLDHAATTPMAPEVLEAMVPFFRDVFGNPSGAYRCGRKARAALGEARERVAACLGCASGEIVFTSGGTESDNLAVRGAALAARAAGKGHHVVTTAIEHKAVLATLHELEALGFTHTVVGVDAHGRVAVDDVLAALRPETALVSVMLANNEVGTLQPVAELGAALRAHDVVLHTDAVQAAAWMDLDVAALQVDMLSLSAHKLYGPKGVGALYVRAGLALPAMQTGGGQESGRRSGTENVAGAVGLATALELGRLDRPATNQRVAALRDRLVAAVAALPDTLVTGHPTARLPGHGSVCIGGVRADVLLLGLDMRGICASSGSACSAGSVSISHVLAALGVPEDMALGALRFSLGRHTTAAEIDYVVDVLPPLVARAREHLAPTPLST